MRVRPNSRFRAFKIILTIKNGTDLSIFDKANDAFAEKIDGIEESVLDLKLAKQQLDRLVEAENVVAKRIKEDVEARRACIIDCSANNRINVAEIRQLADDLISFEQRINTYQY